MSGTATLARAVAEKQIILLKRYWINTALMIVGSYLFFAMMFYGGRAVGGAGIGDTLDGLVVGFFLFTAATAAYFGTAQNLMSEASWGTLEQLFMSPYGIDRVMAVKSAWNVSYSLLVGVLMLGIMLTTTDRSIAVDVVTVAPILLLAICSVVGLGFVFAGLSLLYKRIESANRLVQFAIIGLVVAPGAAVPTEWLALLPLSLGSALLRSAMLEGVRLWEFEPHLLALLAVNGAVYLGLGYAAFRLLVRRARKLGVMGHY